MGKRHEEDVKKYYLDVFGFDSSIKESSRKLVALFSDFGADMYYDGIINREQVGCIPCDTKLDENEIFEMINGLIRK